MYVETSFLLCVAMGRDPVAAGLPARSDLSFRVAMPGSCFMEAFSVLEREIGAQNQFVGFHMKYYENEAGRNLLSSHARDLNALLGEVRIKLSDLLNETEERLRQIAVWLCEHGEIIPTEAETVRQALAERRLGDPTDNLIFHVVTQHARSRGPGPKAFLSENRKHFGTPDVRKALEASGLKYFESTTNAVGWLESHRPG